MDMKKILLIANSSFTIFNFRSELIAELKKRGYEIHIACPQMPSNENQKNTTEYIEEMNIHYHKLIDRSNLNPISNIFLILKIMKIIKK